MHVQRSSLLLLGLLLASCAPADETSKTVEIVVGSAKVSGTLEGSPVRLPHAALVPGGRLSILCISDEPIATADCGYFDESDRILVYAHFAQDSGNLRWAFPRVELLRTGSRPRVRLSRNGSITADATAETAYQVELSFGADQVRGTVRF